jgi:hypothetical protein
MVELKVQPIDLAATGLQQGTVAARTRQPMPSRGVFPCSSRLAWSRLSMPDTAPFFLLCTATFSVLLSLAVSCCLLLCLDARAMFWTH